MPKDCYEIILNHNCDLACGFCSQSDFDPAAKCSLRNAVHHICAAKKQGYKRIGFSGGEALLHEDLTFLTAAARRAGFKVIRLQTNGMKLSNPALCLSLAEAGLTVCKFTFLGNTSRVHDRLTGASGSFRKSLAGLDHMLALKLTVGVNLLITRHNYDGLKPALKFFMDRGVSEFVLIYPIYVGRMRENFKTLGISMPEASAGISKALDFTDSAGLGAGVKALNMPPCLLPGHERKAVDLYKFNTVVAPPGRPILDLDKNVSEAKERGPVCARCFFRRKCGGVNFNYLALFGWKGFKPAAGPAKRKKLRPAPGYLSGMEKCFVEVLKKEDGIPTSKVLELARSLPLCHDCDDGAGVLTTGEVLINKGLIKRDFKKGKYLWRLA
ncbi:MAG: hypothetical protein A2270_09615 [Elusimicrobia bacterium RIFOXYA12_FULL_51_18]|nr:MAG: hypothetical protein A2270_09615 [Elusimicrobia bacterium RIFOXYA12_FULL_51_18]OGS32759.1 MAG: hypothetical protein A2218_11930 [Elusimicrobia bacterium RIFOXYA2_FULL_53_38]